MHALKVMMVMKMVIAFALITRAGILLKGDNDIPLLAIPPNESSYGEHLIFGQSLVAWQPPSQKGILSSFFTRTGDRLSRRIDNARQYLQEFLSVRQHGSIL
ncbi:hypothetical protein Peur_008205 [Populus x canadensis]